MRSLLRRGGFALLLSIALPGAVRNAPPAIALNHLALVADSATFYAIASSPFLRDTFALFEGVQATEDDRVALFGRSTYVEFRRGSDVEQSAWTSRLALGTDVPGTLRAVASRLTNDLGPLRLDSISRRRDSTDVPWFYQLALSDAAVDSTLALRVVEYHPAFLRLWYDAAADRVSVARSDVIALRTGRSTSKQRYPFVDVVAVKVAAPAHAAERIVRRCRAIGWRVQPATGGTACVGPDVRLFVVPAQQHERGIVAFTMRIAPGAAIRGPSTRSFGTSVLRFSRSGFATWQFVGR